MTFDSNNIDPNAFLMGGKSKSAKFPEIGAVTKGAICEPPVASQQTDYDTGVPLSWDDGKKKMQLIVVVQTDEREDNDDDGTRSIFIKGAMQAAVRDAVKASGSKGLAVGGVLAVKFSGEKPAANSRHKPVKLFQAQYTPPVAGESFFNDVPATQNQQAGFASVSPASDSWNSDAPF